MLAKVWEALSAEALGGRRGPSDWQPRLLLGSSPMPAPDGVAHAAVRAPAYGSCEAVLKLKYALPGQSLM